MRRLFLLVGLVLLGCAAPAAPAAAHPMPHSVVDLDIDDTTVDATLLLPADELATAGGLGNVRGYLTDHVRAATADGAAWSVRVTGTRLGDAEQAGTGPYRELTAHAVLTPPFGAAPTDFTLSYDAIVHHVVTHVALVRIRDERGATQVGTIRIDPRTMTVPPLAVHLGTGARSGFVAMLELGSRHILEGTDHLLFLFTLLLPAALVADRGRWDGVVSPRRALRRIGVITLAFTVGHSVALAASAVTRWSVPSRPVEVFIAASILLSAVHAIRPLFPGREAAVAGVFGLGHGMAFALTLAELDLSAGQLMLSLLGFNVGIELVQLLLVALALPGLLVLARLRSQPVLRTFGAGLAALAAAGWLLARLGVPNPVAGTADGVAAHPSLVLAALLASAAAATVWTLRRWPPHAPVTPAHPERVH